MLFTRGSGAIIVEDAFIIACGHTVNPHGFQFSLVRFGHCFTEEYHTAIMTRIFNYILRLRVQRNGHLLIDTTFYHSIVL